MCRVRGIGVAVRVSTSTCVRSCLIRSLCFTPKRCSSSTTSSPRSLNADLGPEQLVGADQDVDLALPGALAAPRATSGALRIDETTSMVTG